MSKVIIIGGGAAGMMAAIAASDTGKEVVLLEKNEKLGKKLYITGKGRCNVTNASDMEEIFANVVTNKKFMYSAFYTLSNDTLQSMFTEDFKVPLKVERGNRVFPVSDRSSDIISGLTRALNKRNVDICLNSTVKEIIIENEKAVGVILNTGEKIHADAIIVATGGVSYASTGSTGDGYEFARKSGHTLTDRYPALVPLEVKEEFVKELSGLALKNVRVSFHLGEKEIYSDFGEMLFTHFGVSGPTVLSASSFITKRLNDKSQKSEILMKIDLKPALSFDELDQRIIREFNEFINKDFRNSLNKLLPKSLIPIVIELSQIDQFKKVNEITKEERKRLVTILKEFTLRVTKTRDFNEAIITQGGVSVKDINPGTMESKKVKGLYFAGEVIDVDALTGGYNLQVAWSTGYLAGISVE